MAALHPDMVEILALVARQAEGQPKLCDMTPAEAREAQARDFTPFWTADAPPIKHAADRKIPGPHGHIPIRVYDPGAPPGMASIVFIHGGGWVVGTLESHDGVCRRLAKHSGLRVVSIDYRLAPEHKFPIPVEDCVAALRWLGQHGAELGIDPARLTLTGDSAGGNLSLASAMVLRDRGGPHLKAVGLIYGAFSRDVDTPSYRAYGGGEYFLGHDEMVWFWNHYLRDEADRHDPLAVPLEGRLDGLPPLLVIGAEFDPLLDDSHMLVERLNAAGAPHDWLLWPGVTHACIHMTRMLAPADGFVREVAVWLKDKALG
jgi:acetyl esterase